MNNLDDFANKLNENYLWKGSKVLKRNEYLKVAGTIDTKLYLVVEGSLRIFIVDNLEEHTIRFGYKNNFIAALDSFITNTPSDLYIQALKRTEVKIISKDAYMSFVQGSAENQQQWHIILQQLIYQQMERERDLLTSSPVERYKRVLKRSPQLFQEIPHKYIASYLRMTPETLSRIKKS